MSIPMAGITTSHKPKTVATLISVRRSTPLTPMAIAAPKLFSPSATATTRSAIILKLSNTRAAYGAGKRLTKTNGSGASPTGGRHVLQEAVMPDVIITPAALPARPPAAWV